MSCTDANQMIHYCTRKLRTIFVYFVSVFLFFESTKKVVADNNYEIVQTLYNDLEFDNPWNIPFDTVYANGFSLQNVELLRDNMWAIKGLATLPRDAGIVFFFTSPHQVFKINNFTNDQIRPFLTTEATLFVSNNDELDSSSIDEFIQLTANTRTHNFTGMINTSEIQMSVKMEEGVNADESTHVAVVNIVLRNFNFTSSFHDFSIGAAFLHSTNKKLDSIHIGTVRIFDPENKRLTNSITAVTENNLHFVENFAFKLLQITPGQNYLILQLLLRDDFYLPIVQTSASYFFVGSPAANLSASWSPLCGVEILEEFADVDAKVCSSTPVDLSLPLCKLVSIDSNTSTMESIPMTVPITYNMILPIPFMLDTVSETDWLFLKLALHATQKHVSPTIETQQVYMDWNFKIPLKQSLTPCVNELLIETANMNLDPEVKMSLFKGAGLTPLSSFVAFVSASTTQVTDFLSIADIRATSVLENMQILSLIGHDKIFQPPALDALVFVDITLIHVRNNELYDQIQKLMQLGLAYSVENQRVKISSELATLCSDESVCVIDPVLTNQNAANYLEPYNQNPDTLKLITSEKSRLYSIQSELALNLDVKDVEWVNNFIQDASANPAIAQNFVKLIQINFQPNSRHRRVVLVDTRYDWPTLLTEQTHRIITLASYKIM